jgi:hypothetical protein
MKSQARKTSDDHLQPFTIFFKDGRVIAVMASTFSLEPSSDLIKFYKQGTLNTQLFARSSQIALIVSSADLAEVPAFIEMQSQFKQVLKRLDALEQAQASF